MSKTLVTGAGGQLGNEIRNIIGEQSNNFVFCNSGELDIRNSEQLSSFCRDQRITNVINCAAYTAVDRAESEPALADEINHLAIQSLSRICKEQNIRLIHVSTDYVFDGDGNRPYGETAPTNPKSVYGRTKLLGELAMQKVNPTGGIIIRTSWLYSSFGKNFVKTMLTLGSSRKEIGVVFDQIGTPTYARDLARVILEIQKTPAAGSVEIFHYSHEGETSWYDFSKEIMQLTGRDCHVRPIESKDYPTPARRPPYSVLNKAKIKNTYNLNIPHWRDGLIECLQAMGEKVQ